MYMVILHWTNSNHIKATGVFAQAYIKAGAHLQKHDPRKPACVIK